jgi:alkanesulfonate monooxygenase SsuD/methylene tetrahydromethanopterin reductase-like flavin-dependent oxidoreductase (luciferase family)
MWLEFADVLPHLDAGGVEYQGTYYQIPRREVLPKPVQRPHPPLWSACGSDETARLTGSLGMGGLFGSEGGRSVSNSSWRSIAMRCRRADRQRRDAPRG